MPALKEKPIAEGLFRVYSRDGFQDMTFSHAQQAVRTARGALSFEPFPPKGWEKVVPKYRATRNVHPSPNPRHATENPHSYQGDDAQWQHGDRCVRSGEEFETTAWPHRSFMPLNESAKYLLELLRTGNKARLPSSPWIDNQILAPQFI